MRFNLVKMGRQKKGAVPNYRCSPFISQDRPAEVFEIYSYYLPKNQMISCAVQKAETVTVKAEKAISINRRNLGHTMFPSNDLMSRNAQDIGELFNREFEMFANRTKIAAGHTNSPMTCMSC